MGSTRQTMNESALINAKVLRMIDPGVVAACREALTTQAGLPIVRGHERLFDDLRHLPGDY